MTVATAVVVTHNSAGEVTSTLTPLLAAGGSVVVVDNASTDGTLDLVRERFPDAITLANERNVGFAVAVNQGLAHVRTDTVLLVNPDCTVPPATAAGLATFLAERPDVGVAGPRILHPDGTVAVSAHPFESLRTVVASRFGGSLVPVGVRRLLSGRRRRAAYDACRSSLEQASVDWLSGACLAVRMDLLRATGGLDERYFLYYEDEELCWQARQRGADVVYLPDLAVTHIGGASSETGATWPHLYRSMLVFFALHRPTRFHAVRTAILVRSAVGLSTAGARRLLGRPSATGRASAWRAVAAIAWTSRDVDDLRRAA